MATKETNYTPVLILAGAALVLFGGSKLLSSLKDLFSFGSKSEEEKKAEHGAAVELVNSSVWSSSFLRDTQGGKYNKYYILDPFTAQSYVNRIYNAIRGIGTKESDVFGVFRSLRYQTDVPQLAIAYLSMKKKDIVSDLDSDLTDSEMAYINNIIKDKPLGKFHS